MKKKSAHAKAVTREIQNQLGSNKAEDVVWGFVEAVASVVDGAKEAPILGPAVTLGSMIVAAGRGSGADSMLDNPYFIGNGHGEDDPSRVTRRYMRSRHRKNMAGGAASVAGAVGSIWTQVDVAGIGMHGNAVGTTGMHLVALAGMARKTRRGGTIADWLEIAIKMKSIKLATRGAGLAGASIPIPAAGITTGLIAAATATGAKLTLSKACVATALEIHWRARQEQFMSGTALRAGTGGSVGPASRIVWELFTKRGITRLLGKYDIDAIVQEPAGWMAISDKLLLI
ncbi:MAG: hypothetical protein AAF726_01575 [Planctomycetota bacterium]